MPARRPGGKTASRKARQRRMQRPASSAPAPSAAPDATPTPPAEAVSIDPPRRVSAPSVTRAYAPASSSLSDRERAEYHYVERDLRNIGVLTVVLIALLAAAWFVFNSIGLVG